MPDIETLINQMTLEEKAALITGASPWTTAAIPRLGVPQMVLTDGPHGVRRARDLQGFGDSFPATCFPTASCTAASWDTDLLAEMGAAIAEECRALGVHVLLGPGNNIKRSPLGGRNFEYFSEDPYLAGEMASAEIKGVQSQGVGTSLKHYAVNNQETRRFSISAEIDERTLREIYLTGFEMAVKKATPWTVMCAYNKINQEYCSENFYLLTEILKDEWAFEGLIVSDWGAVHDRAASLEAGLDLEMPGPKPRRTQAVVDAVESGVLDEELLDESVRRILRIVFLANETARLESYDADAHHALARRIASEGMVLLKNNGILPLKPEGKIAVIGRAAQAAHFQGGGSSHINPTRVDQPFEELQKLAPNAQMTYAPGYPEDASFQQGLIDEAVANARSAGVALVFVALPAYKESEGYDRTDIDLTPQQVALIQAVGQAQPNTVVILNNGSAVAMSAWIDRAAAVLEAWMMGQAGGGAIADILFGKVSPSGKLAETFPLKLQDTPAFTHFPGGAGEVHYGEGIFVGYRYYDIRGVPVQFPFGYGLSYTRFDYAKARVSEAQFDDVDGVDVMVDVTNSGQMRGKEVVQVYVHDREALLIRPPKELKGFAKVDLAPGETKTVTIHLDARAFAYYHPGVGQWITESGAFDLLVGSSSADIRAEIPVTVNSTVDMPSMLNAESTPAEWMADRRGRVVFGPMYDQMVEGFKRTMGGGADSDLLGMDIMAGFMRETPLRDVLGFQEAELPASPEQIVADLLAKVQAME